MADSTLTIGFTQATKKLTVTGTVAVREASIDVTVTGGAALIADLVLKIQDKSNGGETTPIAVVSSWTASSANAVGTLNLNTAEAVAAFENVGNLGMKTFNVLLYTSTSNALMCNGVMAIMNFPSATSSDPVTLDQTATIQALTDRIVELEASSLTSVHYDDFDDVAALTTGTTLNTLKAKVNEILNILQGGA